MVFHIVMHHICSLVLGRLKYVFFFAYSCPKLLHISSNAQQRTVNV